MSTERQRCFVIMPFSKTSEEHTEDYWTKHFDSYLKPLIEECPELEAQRSEPLRGDILRQIITDLVTCPVVVADLTDHNPNVYWELGVRQSFKHGTVTIAQYGTKLPFDVGAQGTLFYHPKDHVKDADFRRRFKAAIQDCLSQPDIPDSHVLETISGRGTLFQIFQRDEAMRRLDAVISECDSNLECYHKYGEAARKNLEYRSAKEKQEAAEKPVFPSLRLRSLALELLIAHRYLDEDPAFYRSAERAHDWIIAVNEHVGKWSPATDEVEKWVLKGEKGWLKSLNSLKNGVLNAREKISRMF